LHKHTILVATLCARSHSAGRAMLRCSALQTVVCRVVASCLARPSQHARTHPTAESRSLPGFGDRSVLEERRSQPSGKARTVLFDFEAHSPAMQRKSGQKWTACPTGAVDWTKVRQAPGFNAGRLQAPGRAMFNAHHPQRCCRKQRAEHESATCAPIGRHRAPAQLEADPGEEQEAQKEELEHAVLSAEPVTPVGVGDCICVTLRSWVVAATRHGHNEAYFPAQLAFHAWDARSGQETC